MACNNCIECRCPLKLRTSSIEVDDEFLILNVPTLDTDIFNGKRVYICIAQSIPEEATSLLKVQVSFEDGAGKLTLADNCGNFIYADQIRCRRVYHTTAATDSNLLVAPRYEFCRTRHIFPVIEPVPAPVSFNTGKKKKSRKSEDE